LNYLTALKAGGHTNFLQTARDFVSSYPQRGLVIVVSDFLDDNDCERPLQYLSDFGHELMLVQVWAEEDRVPPWDGELELEDAETGQRVELAFDTDARTQYTTGFRRLLPRVCVTSRCEMEDVTSDCPPTSH
jgi:hypothetical protein